MPRETPLNTKTCVAMSNNKGTNFFKFRNVQVVRRPNSGRSTRQHTQINVQGTSEDQFEAIQAAARTEALLDINDILTDNNSVNYSTHEEPLQPNTQVRTQNTRMSAAEDTSTTTPEIVTDTSVDSSSIEVIQPTTGLQIQLPSNPPLQQPPLVPKTRRQMLQSQTTTNCSPMMKKLETKLYHWQ